MKYLNISEALRPSQFREFVLDSDRDKYTDIFKSFKGEHDRNYYRLYFPIIKKKSETHKKIEKLLFKNGYDIVDYIEGRAKYRNARNTTRIGQILQRLEKDDEKAKELCKKFIEDADRKAGSDLMVCISRHPYDIAGSDTDRNWSNCLTMAKTDTKRYRDHVSDIKRELSKINLKKIGEEIDKMLEEDDTLYEIEKVNIDRFSFTHINNGRRPKRFSDDDDSQEILDELEKNNIEIDTNLLVRYEDKDGFVETYNDEFNMKANNYNRIVDMIIDIDKFLKSGTNVGYIKEHIKLGVLACFLIRKDDKNINDPIANLDIKPYFNIFNTDEIFLYPDRRMYGHGTSEFKEVIKSWVNELNKGKVGVYKLVSGCYNDNLMDKTLLVEKDGNVIDDADDTDNYSIDKKTLKMYSNRIKNIKTDEEAKQFAQYVLSGFGKMNGGDVVNDILLLTPEKWHKYYRKTNNRINGWI